MSARHELAAEPPEHAASQDRLGRTVRRDDEEPRRLAPPRNRRAEVERRRIAPLQVLEHDHHRRESGDGLERLRDLAQHALAGHAEELVSEGGAVRLGDQPGELGDPARSVAPQQRDDRRGVAAASEPAEGLEDRPVGLARPRSLEALPASHRQAERVRARRQEKIDQGRLADAGLARDEDEAPTTGEGALERRFQPRHLRGAADEGSSIECLGALARRDRKKARGRARGGGGSRGGSVGSRLAQDLADEAVAAPMDRREKAWLARVVAEGTAHLVHVSLEDALGDVGARPERFEELLLQDQPARALEEVAQQRERARRQLDLLAATLEALGRAVEAKGPEGKGRSRQAHDVPLSGSCTPQRCSIATMNSAIAASGSRAEATARPASVTAPTIRRAIGRTG